MSRHYELTRRRAAAMREMADLGCTASDVAMLLNIDLSRVCQIRQAFSITLRKARKGKEPWLQNRILKDFGKIGITPSVMGARYGTSANSVSVRMNQMRKEGKLPPVQERC